MLRRDCRHRLGSTVGGAFSSERKPYGSRLQTTLPCADVIRAFSSVPRKPRDASSKSRVSENGSVSSVAACCATTDAEASLGTSLLPVWVIELFSPAVAFHGSLRDRKATTQSRSPSFREGPKNQTRNLEIPGSMLRIAPE